MRESLYSLILKRRSIRLFKQKKVPKTTIQKVINAARVAPSAANLQFLEYLVVTDKKIHESNFIFSDVLDFDRKTEENGWVFGDVNISIIHELERIDEVFYQINDGDWISYNEPLFFSEEGINVFSWYAVDSEGYTSTPDSILIKIDKNSPEINLKKKRLDLCRNIRKYNTKEGITIFLLIIVVCKEQMAKDSMNL